MADPFTAAGLGASALGGVVGAVGNLLGGNAKADMYNYQAGIAKVNATIAKQNADYSRATGGVEANQLGMRQRFQAGKIVAGQGASGLDVNSGSAVQVQRGQQLVSTMDQGIVRSNASRRAYGFDVEAYNKTAESSVYGMAAENAQTAGVIGAFSSILGAAGSVASKWSQGNQIGLFGSGGSSTGGFGEGIFNATGAV